MNQSTHVPPSTMGSLRCEGFPEIAYYQNCLVIGNIPLQMNINKLYSYIEKFENNFLKKTVRQKIIADLRNPQMKAVLFYFENETLARFFANRLSNTPLNSHFAFYDGNYVFLYFQQLESKCEPRSRNVTISGFNARTPKGVYLNLFLTYGTVRYYEFCTEGEVTNARIEYERLTSAFAATFSLQSSFKEDTIINLEIPLFQVPLLSPGSERGWMVPQLAVSQPEITEVISPPDVVREQFPNPTMNTISCTSFGRPRTDLSSMEERKDEYTPRVFGECSGESVLLQTNKKQISDHLRFSNITHGGRENFEQVPENSLFHQPAAKSSSLAFKMPKNEPVNRHL